MLARQPGHQPHGGLQPGTSVTESRTPGLPGAGESMLRTVLIAGASHLHCLLPAQPASQAGLRGDCCQPLSAQEETGLISLKPAQDHITDQWLTELGSELSLLAPNSVQ